MGYWEDGKLRYAEHVGTGFSDKILAQIRERLTPLVVSKTPFDTEPDSRRLVTWVRPQVVVKVQYYEWTPTGHLRHPVFLRIRDDIDPVTVIGRPKV